MSSSERRAPRLTRRRFLRRAVGGSMACIGGGTVALSAFGERNWPRVYRVTVRLPDLPPGLRGLTIAQMSDFHRGPFISEGFLRRAAGLAQSLKPDLIALTGDFVSPTNRYAESCAKALSGLRAPLGVYGVLGNHDHWTEDVERVSTALERNGVRLLTNRSAKLARNGSEGWICGVDDVWSGDPVLEAALQDVPETAFRFLLCHAPDFADDAAKMGVPLQLSGHTHGGQVILPGHRPLVTPRHGHKYTVGLRQVENSSSLVYTNVGLGTVFVPVRINCAPEVTLLTLELA